MGERRFERSFCVHAERIRVEDYQFLVCRNLEANPAPELYTAIEERVREGLARSLRRPANDFEVMTDEGLQSVITLDVCLRQWDTFTHDQRRDSVIVLGSIDGSRPLHVELHAARGVGYRIRGSDDVHEAEVGEWPRDIAARGGSRTR